MFISVLTKDNHFYIFDLELERKFNIHRDRFTESNDSMMNETEERHLIEEETGEKQSESVDYIQNTE